MFESVFQILANRIGFTELRIGQLKILLEVMTLWPRLYCPDFLHGPDF